MITIYMIADRSRRPPSYRHGFEAISMRNKSISRGQERAWRDPEIRARRQAAISASWDDPLLLALQRIRHAQKTPA